MPTLECSQHRSSHSSGILMTPPTYARVQHRYAHLRMPTLECSQHRSGSLHSQLDEEEERRKRRREKNKVAAARCRNKKKERTEFLQRESERLELMNAELKTQIEELKQERQQLILMLNRHRPTCIVRTDSVKTPESEGNPLLEQLEKK
ncbi:Jun dimerization protein 2 [Galemys pyrenaicus]|uniref:Jun dimerization protein 2 n=1 Tax=Galemys pyrenaicus TaxID=202257 RepID=A0A8J6A7F5_GALPY|nr:Jun dimerization protein 2 [Galemys pyrenaicus]